MDPSASKTISEIYQHGAANSVTWLEQCGSGRHFTTSCFEMIELTEKAANKVSSHLNNLEMILNHVNYVAHKGL